MTTTGPFEHSCYVCSAPNAAWGYGWPGPSRDRPDKTVLWGCFEHRHEVERINKERMGLR